MTAAISLRDVTVHSGRTEALSRFTLDVAVGETVALLGPSGSGKSTALKAVAGFHRPTSGAVYLEGRDVTDAPPRTRGVGVVVQQYALFPHMRVADNVAFGLEARRVARADRRTRAAEVLDLVGMGAYARRYPRELSGGQQQRIAIARALAIRPKVLLLDEPLSALDASLRAEMVGELQRLRRELPDIAILYVTHDQTEALALADRIAVMRDARLVDAGAKESLYHRPPSAFTAEFLGAANLIPARWDGDALRVGVVAVPAPVGDGPRPEHPLVCVRPHALDVTAPEGGEGLPARITGVQWRGAAYRVTCLLDATGTEVRADVAALEGVPGVGERASVRLPERGITLVAGEKAEVGA